MVGGAPLITSSLAGTVADEVPERISYIRLGKYCCKADKFKRPLADKDTFAKSLIRFNVSYFNTAILSTKALSISIYTLMR